MAKGRPRLPVGGGDSIVVWRSVIVWICLYTALIALFALAIITADQAQPTTSGKIQSAVFFGLFIALFVFGLVIAILRRTRMQISADTILYVTAKDNTLELYRQSGTVLRVVARGSRRFLTNGDGAMVLPLSGYSPRKLRDACTARGWQFPAEIPRRGSPPARRRGARRG